MSLTAEIVGAVVRWGLSMLSLYLVQHHVLTVDQSERATDALVQHAILFAPAFLALAWSVINKYRNRWRLD